MDPRLDGTVALVTGASSGIGAATAKALAGAGASVVLFARRADRLKALAEELAHDGGRSLAVDGDVTDRAAVDRAVRAAESTFGPVDVLVNNAGVMFLSRLADGRVDDWERMIDVNVKGVLFGIAAVLPSMIERGAGHIVNVGSLSGRRPLPAGAVYAATKFAVRAISAGIQLELSASSGIRVTDIEPGVVRTELMDHIPDPEVRDSFRDAWAQKRPLAADDVAQAVLYAVAAPSRVNVNEILIRPTDQGN